MVDFLMEPFKDNPLGGVAWIIFIVVFAAAVVALVAGIIWGIIRRLKGSDPEKEEEEARAAYGGLIGRLGTLVFAAVLGWMAWDSLDELRKANYAAKYWPSTQGIVLSSQISALSKKNFKVYVEYGYMVSDSIYRSGKVNVLAGKFSLNKAEAESLRTFYAPKSNIKVLYDPKAPGQSILPGNHRGFLSAIIMALLAVLCLANTLFPEKLFALYRGATGRNFPSP